MIFIRGLVINIDINVILDFYLRVDNLYHRFTSFRQHLKYKLVEN